MNDRSKPKSWEEIPFGALDLPPDVEPPRPSAPAARPAPAAPAPAARHEAPAASPRPTPPPAPVARPQEERAAPAAEGGASREGDGEGRRRRRGRRGRRDHDDRPSNENRGPGPGPESDPRGSHDSNPDSRSAGQGDFEGREPDERGSERPHPGQGGFEFEGDERAEGAGPDDFERGEGESGQPGTGQQDQGAPGEWRDGRRRRRRRGRRGRGGPGGDDAPRFDAQGRPLPPPQQQGQGGREFGERGNAVAHEQRQFPQQHSNAPQYSNAQQHSNAQHSGQHQQQRHGQQERAPAQVLTGMLVLEKGGFGELRRLESQYLPGKEDIFVAPHLVQRFKLREGSLITGPCTRGQQHKFQLQAVEQVDGKDPREVVDVVPFKKLTSIDPDFHYAVGDVQGDASMRVLDVICPVGRGSRGLIVAPPRSGKTILMRKFANAITEGYPDVHLMVLLIDERPEEATEWQRSTKGQVFVSTNDEDTKNHVELAEAVFKRCQRLVELGHDVVLLLDSITRLARAYNNHAGTSGKTMSGGLDSRAMERPRAFFGMARNTETAGSLTILGTTLVDTGSRLDQIVFEEFKGTGNMEIVLSRKLADRRIFPSIDIERSGTRKEEKLHSSTRLKRVQVLRRVLLKMNFVEAMELLIHKLEDVDKIDDFLKRFDVDPDA
ncbi:MAG: transcription termination factor Rho [Planctomycetota bacterium]|nr:transcription termination factor Rho [Planctomycetota bacterium]